ncbi:MAG: TNT domain-containing protein [Microbacterium sp.]
MPSAIDPTQIPGKEIDPDAVESHGRTVGTIAASVRDNGSNVHLTWQGMAGVYSAPESGTLLGLMQPVSSQATTAGDNLDVVSAALVQFASDVRPIKAELDSLRAQAQAFVDTTVANGVRVREVNPAWMSTQGYQGSWSAYGAYSSPSTGGTATQAPDVPQYRYVTKEWHEDQDAVDRNNDLISAVNAQQVALWEAERTCANKIRALYGAAPLHAATSEDDALAYGLDEIPEGTEMPWGAPVERSEGCGEATFNFVVKDFLWEGIAVGGVWGTIQGLGTLVLGYNPATGDWFSGEAYGAAWGNLGMLTAGALISSTPPLSLMFAADDIAQQFGGGFLPEEISDFKDSTDEAWLNTGKALIAWDKWQDDPGTALGESVFNVGTLLIPVGGAAVAGVKTASTAASVLTRMARVVDFIDPAAWALNGTMRLGGAGLGSLDNLIGRMDFAASDFDVPHIEVYTAMDSASALRSLDDWGVDMSSVTARLDEGMPVLEFPGGRIELPEGAFDAAGVRPGDGGLDASITTPVREPELVGAGGVRGESGPGPVNSIVDETPVRTETGGSGESVTTNPSTETGGGSGTSGPDGGSGGGSGGSGSGGASDSGGGSGSGGDGTGEGPAGDGSSPTPDQSAAHQRAVEALEGDRVVTESGSDISDLISRSDLEPDQLASYLQSADAAGFEHFAATGEWPSHVQIPEHASSLKTYPDGTIAVDWQTHAPERGYVLDENGVAIKEIVSPTAGAQFDRYGPPSGLYVSPVIDGVPFAYDARSLPYVEDAAQYHRYEIVRDFSELDRAISELNDPARVAELRDTIELYNPSLLTKQGEVAAAFQHQGGGIQMELPLTVNDLLDLGMIREVN